MVWQERWSRGQEGGRPAGAKGSVVVEGKGGRMADGWGWLGEEEVVIEIEMAGE